MCRWYGSRRSMHQRTRSHLRDHRKSFRFDADHAASRLQSRSRSGSHHSGEGKFQLDNAADRQSFWGNYKRSRDTAVPRQAFAMMNTMIFSFPGETHCCCQRISVVLPLIHKSRGAAQPLCDKVPCIPVTLKTHKVVASIFPLRGFRGRCRCISAGCLQTEREDP
jgi:hypothetical protein